MKKKFSSLLLITIFIFLSTKTFSQQHENFQRIRDEFYLSTTKHDMKFGQNTNLYQDYNNYFWEEGQWLLSNNTQYTYNQDGYTIYELLTSEEGNTSDQTNIYSTDGFLLETIERDKVDNEWINIGRTLYTYDENGFNYETFYQEWIVAVWVSTSGVKNITTFEDNRITQEETFNWDFTSQSWINSSKLFIYYDQQGIRENIIAQIWDTHVNSYINITQGFYTYIDGSTTILENMIIQRWEIDEWINSTKQQYSYENNTKTSTSFSWTKNQWADLSRNIVENNIHGDVIKETYEFFVAGEWTQFSGMEYLLNYAGDNLTQRITKKYNIITELYDNFQKEVFSNFLSLSIIDTDRNQTLNLYPNPVSDKLGIHMNSAKTQNIKFNIYSIEGKLIYSTKKTIIPGKNNIRLQVDLMHKGLYILRVINNSNVLFQKKFIKQ